MCLPVHLPRVRVSGLCATKQKQPWTGSWMWVLPPLFGIPMWPLADSPAPWGGNAGPPSLRGCHRVQDTRDKNIPLGSISAVDNDSCPLSAGERIKLESRGGQVDAELTLPPDIVDPRLSQNPHASSRPWPVSPMASCAPAHRLLTLAREGQQTHLSGGTLDSTLHSCNKHLLSTCCWQDRIPLGAHSGVKQRPCVQERSDASSLTR